VAANIASDGNSMFDFTRAPFQVRADADAFQVAEEIAACFEVVSNLADKVTRAVGAAMHVLGVARDAPLARAMAMLAAEIDAGVGDGRANPYHNSQHYCEVMLSALVLSTQASLSPAERLRVVAAALAHDFHHDGRSSIGLPFRLERLAAHATMPYLDVAGAAQDEQARVAALILATETTVGVPFARQCHDHFTRGEPLPVPPPMEPKLAMLAQDAALARQAVVLAEADLLPSVGLTVYYGELTQANLAKEWGRPMTAVDKLYFLEHVFGDFSVSRFFSPNVQRLKDAMRKKAEAIKR
jgi:hypothetical protein